MSSMVHKARPARISENSLPRSGVVGAWPIGSGERKEDLLEARARPIDAGTQLRQRSGTANASFDKQHESIANPLRVAELVDGQNKRSAGAGKPPQSASDVPGLLEIEAVERFVHEQQRMRHHEAQGQHEPARISFR